MKEVAIKALKERLFGAMSGQVNVTKDVYKVIDQSRKGSPNKSWNGPINELALRKTTARKSPCL